VRVTSRVRSHQTSLPRLCLESRRTCSCPS
jgi:hypothetical protein